MIPTRWPVLEFSATHRGALQSHFAALDREDRRLRFGTPLSDTALHAYVERLDFDRDAVFGVVADELEVIGAAHLARTAEHAELGLSVLPEHRQRGLGAALLGRALLRARNWGVNALFMHCLRENDTMMHLARKLGMRVVIDQTEADAWLHLPRPDASSYFGELLAQRVALFDYTLKSQIAGTRRLVAVGLGLTRAKDG